MKYYKLYITLVIIIFGSIINGNCKDTPSEIKRKHKEAKIQAKISAKEAFTEIIDKVKNKDENGEGGVKATIEVLKEFKDGSTKERIGLVKKTVEENRAVLLKLTISLVTLVVPAVISVGAATYFGLIKKKEKEPEPEPEEEEEEEQLEHTS